MSESLSLPHGGSLVNRVLNPEARGAATTAAGRMPQVRLNPVQYSDLLCIATGVFSPLTGFVGANDYASILDRLRLADGTVWSIPITLAASADVALIAKGSTVALTDPNGDLTATLDVTETFEYDKAREARAVYGTDDPAHPGVARLLAQGEVLMAGPVALIHPQADPPFAAFRRDPVETRRLFAERGWRRVVGFQTRNPVHRAHEYIQKAALEICDGLLLNPLVGETKNDDVSAATRMKSYEALVDNYYPANRVLLNVFPAAMRYAGPREAVFHAIARKNYGCTHFIVGRDHAGVGNYYGPYDAQKIFDEFTPQELGITPLFFDNTFFCRKCGGMASSKTCPHDASLHVTLSGTQVRTMLRAGQMPPPEFTRSEVAQVLIDGMRLEGVTR